MMMRYGCSKRAECRYEFCVRFLTNRSKHIKFSGCTMSLIAQLRIAYLIQYPSIESHRWTKLGEEVKSIVTEV